MEAFLIKVGLQVVFTFFQKNPWTIVPFLILLALPFILIASMFSAAASGISGSLQVNYSTCSDAYKKGIDSVFKGTAADDMNARLAKSTVTGDCAKDQEDAASGYMYDSTIWQQVVDTTQGYIDDESPYDQTKLDALLKLALSGTGNGLNAADKKYYQDQVKKQFKDFETASKGDKAVYTQIRDYAQGIVDISSVGYASGDAQAMIAAARTRIGMPYVLGGAWTPSKQGYYGLSSNGSYGYGFDCARLVGWALAKVTGVNTNGAEMNAPYARANVDIQYAALIAKGATKVAEKDAQPGDFVYINGDHDGTWSHVALYTGTDHAGVRQFIEAATGSTNAVIERPGYWWMSEPHQYLRVLSGDDVATGSVKSVGGVKNYAASQLSKFGWGANSTGNQQFVCLDNLWTKESNWNPTIQGQPTTVQYNGRVIPARAYGIPQSLPGQKMATVADGGGPDWRTNPATQINWGLTYIKRSSYGSPCAAWQHSVKYNWY